MNGILIAGLIIGGFYLFARKKPDPGPAPRPSPCPPMGDVDGDGFVTKKDADLVSESLANFASTVSTCYRQSK